METENSIYIVKGKENSALINLETYELRSISNKELDKLEDNVELGEELSKLIQPGNDVFNKEILDIKLLQETDLNSISNWIEDGKVYHNVRVFCPVESEVTPDYLKELIEMIDHKVYHFGIIIIIPENYNRETFEKYFSNYKVLSLTKQKSDGKLYEPRLYSTPEAIYRSKENNFFHYSRDTLHINGKDIKRIDHNLFNIPKHRIEGCKNCEFRLTCYDEREVLQDNEKFYYNSTCKYEL